MSFKLRDNKSNILFFMISSVLAAGSALAIANLDSDLGLYGLVGLIGVAVVLTMFAFPGLGANILIIAVFTNISDELTNNGYPGIIKPLVAVVVITIAARYIYFEKKTSVRSKTGRIEALLFLYFVVYAASYSMASNQNRATTIILDVGKDIIIIYCILYALRTPEALKRSIWIVILATCIMSLLGIYQLLTGNFSQDFFGLAMVKMDNFSGSTTPRLGGPINDPNMWGQVVISIIPLIIFRIIHERRISIKLLGGLILGVLLYETLATYSRGAYLALVIVVFLIFFVFEDGLSPVFAVAGIGLMILVIPFIPVNYTERFQSLLILTPSNEFSIYEDSSLRGRSSEYLTGFSMFKSSPLLGIGAGNYKINYQKFSQNIGIETRAEPRDPHSLFVQLLAENGILGLLAFIGVVTSLFTGLSKAKKSVQYLPALKQTWSPWISSLQISLIGYLIAATFLHGAYIRYFWILFGLSITAIRLTSEMLKNDKQRSILKADA